jgi:hypothetical protein
METNVLRSLPLALVLLAAAPALAESPLPDACKLPASGVDPLGDRAAILAEYERLPTPCLRAIFTACTQAAERHLLDFGSAAFCSFGYEALLRQSFGGNFQALLVWWNSERAQALQ